MHRTEIVLVMGREMTMGVSSTKLDRQWQNFCGCPATQQMMAVPRHRLSTVDHQAYTVQGPMVWNSVQDDLRAQQDYESFRHRLKTWLFPSYQHAQRIRDFVTAALYKFTFTTTINICTQTQKYLTAFHT